MKKFNHIFLLAFVLLLTGCNDAIDIDQPGRLTEDAAFESVSDLESGVLGLYRLVDVTPEIQHAAIFTDELSIGFDNGGQGIQAYGFQLNPGSTAPANFWTRNYDLANATTRLIEAAANIDAGEDQAAYNTAVGEAHVLRAWAHFELLSYFSTDLTDDSALGVIRLDFVPSVSDQLLRNTNGEVFDLILSDLNKAEGLIAREDNPTFISTDMIKAFKARIAAYRGRYSEALPLALELYEKYGLADRDQYLDMFIDEDNTEIIFKLERAFGDPYDGQGATGSANAGGWAGAIFAFTGPGLDGSPYFEMGRSLFNELDPADVRYDVNVHPSSTFDENYPNTTQSDFNANDLLVVDKYPGSEGRPLMNDLKIFRSSEMLFIAAEAYVAAGQLDNAAQLLKELRDARFGAATALSSFANATEAWGAIVDERRIELAFEGHRYKDIKRLGAVADRQVEKDPLDCSFNGACSLAPDDYRFTFPLPIVEFNANPGLREQQNPGY